MKKQNNIRRFISFLLCLVMAVSAFSMLSFADDNEAVTYAYNCTSCNGKGCVEWLPLGEWDETSTHTYVTYNSDGTSNTHTCYVTTRWGGECLVCLACGAIPIENERILWEKHSGCGR